MPAALYALTLPSVARIYHGACVAGIGSCIGNDHDCSREHKGCLVALWTLGFLVRPLSSGKPRRLPTAHISDQISLAGIQSSVAVHKSDRNVPTPTTIKGHAACAVVITARMPF